MKFRSLFVSILKPIVLICLYTTHSIGAEILSSQYEWKSNVSRPITLVHSSSDQGFIKALEETLADENVDISWMDQSALKSKLLSASDKQQLPDIVIASSDLLGLSDTLSFSQIPEEWEKAVSSQNSLISTLRADDGALYGMPLAIGNSLILFYNKSYIPIPANKWKDLLLQQSLLPNGVKIIGWPVLDMYWLIPFMTAFGPAPKVSDKVIFDADATNKGIEFVWELIDKQVLTVDCNYQCSVDNFLSGKLAYIITGTWEIGNFKEVMGERLGVSTLPEINSRPMRSYYNTLLMMFPRKSLSGLNRNRIIQVSRKLRSESFSRVLNSSFNLIPTNDYIKDNKPDKRLSVTHLVSLEALKLALPIPQSEATFIMWEAMIKGFARYGGGALPEDAVSQYIQSYVDEQSSHNIK